MLMAPVEVEPFLRAPGHPCARLSACDCDGRWHLTASLPDTGPVTYPMAGDQPVLIDFHHSVASPEWFAGHDAAASPVPRRARWPRRLKGLVLGTAQISARNVRQFRAALPPDAVVLMVGAASMGMGMEPLYEAADVRQIAFDIYPSPLTHFVADAHEIPIADQSVDAVCVQAVLEHVVDPVSVVAEIERVLKPGGLVYAETPFMQQVHEGAYDFTRFTELGHRWLWRRFATMARGPLGGPGLSMYWSSRYFLRGLLRSRRAGDVASLPFGLLAMADRWMPAGDLIDGASGAFFFGRKGDGTLQPRGLVAEYLGAQRTGTGGEA